MDTERTRETKLTKSELTGIIEGAVSTAVSEIKKDNDNLRKELDDVKSKKVKDEKPDTNMPIFEELKSLDNEGRRQYEDIAINFKPKTYTDEWFLQATPAQRFIAMCKGLKDGQESLIVNSHAMGNLIYKADGTAVRDFDRRERMAVAHEVSKQLSITNNNAAGFLVSPDYRQELINCMYTDPTNLMSRFTTWQTDTRKETYAPVQTGGVTVYWKGEAATKPKSYPRVEQLSWKPKKQVVHVDLTEELMEDARPDAAEWLRSEMARSITLDSIYSVFYGDGVNQPRGLNLDIPAANTVFVRSAFNSEDLKILKCRVRQDRRVGGWFYAPDCVWCQVERFATLLNYEWQQSMDDMLKEGVPGKILGYDYYRGVDETMPISYAETGTGTGDYGHMFFGNPANYYIVIRHDLRIKYNGFYDHDKNVVAFIGEQSWDGRMICDGFSKLEGVNC